MSVDFEKVGRAALDAGYKHHCDAGGLPLCSDERVCAWREAVGRAAVAAYLAQICGPDCGTCRLYSFRCEWAQPLPDVAPVHASQFLPGPNCPAAKKEG